MNDSVEDLSNSLARSDPRYGLTFAALRAANLKRLSRFKNRHGGLAHSEPDGSDWSPAQWLQALIGELGEFANKRKKYERGDLTFAEFKIDAAKELADVQIYLDLLALRVLDGNVNSSAFAEDARSEHMTFWEDGRVVHPTGIDLGQAVIDKWNEVSLRINCNLYMDVNGWHYIDPALERKKSHAEQINRGAGGYD